jgi:hypothetical protein
LKGPLSNLYIEPSVRTRWLDLALFTAIVMGGAALRWVHLGTPSLWWDELVQIAMAQVGGVTDVLRVVREGVPPGSGNAGAMPLDYLLLHAWLALVREPDPAHLEVHFRLPAFTWSVCALVALAVFTRRHLGREIGLAATLLLGASMPHVLYAAEVRWYSLLVLVTIGHLWAFARLLDAPDVPGRWAWWLACAATAVCTAILSVVPLGAELAVVAARARSSRRALIALVVSGTLLAVLVAGLASPTLGVMYGLPVSRRPGFLRTTSLVAGFFAWDQPALLLAVALGTVLGWRDPRLQRIVCALALSFVAIPLTTALADWKGYYVHPRHVLFLLPAFVILAAIGIVEACRRLVSARFALPVALAFVAVTQAPTVGRYLRDPDPFFARTKTVRDVRGVVTALPPPMPGTRWLVLAARDSVPNAVLARYLRWWGLEHQVVLLGTRDLPGALRLLTDRGTPLDQLVAPPLATIPVGLTEQLRLLLGIRADPVPPTTALAGATVVAWDDQPPAPGLVRRKLVGVETFERPR